MKNSRSEYSDNTGAVEFLNCFWVAVPAVPYPVRWFWLCQVASINLIIYQVSRGCIHVFAFAKTESNCTPICHDPNDRTWAGYFNKLCCVSASDNV